MIAANRYPGGVPPPDSPIFVGIDEDRMRAVRRLLRRMPPLSGAPVHVRCVAKLRDRYGPVHAGSFLRERRIHFACAHREFPRIFVHELFHFVWLRAGNPARLAFEEFLRGEILAGVPGELGWSAQWRKEALTPADVGARTRRWREYCCESFCDTAAWLYSGVRSHPEFTLAPLFRQRRASWFRDTIASRQLSI